jgi:Ring finger domain
MFRRRLQDAGNRRFRSNVRETLAGTRCMYIFLYILYSLEIMTTIIVISMTVPSDCDTPLDIWIIIYGVRACVYLPLTIYEQHRNITAYPGHSPQHRTFRAVRSVIDVVALIWFILGNSYVFNADTCKESDPILFYACLAFLCIGYASLGMPFLLCLAFVFCFPCMYHLLQMVSADNEDNDPERVEKRISKLKHMTYQPGMYTAEDAECAVCMEDYKLGDELRELPCKHHFHQECCDRWLRMKQTCPLCVQRIDKVPKSASKYQAASVASSNSSDYKRASNASASPATVSVVAAAPDTTTVPTPTPTPTPAAAVGITGNHRDSIQEMDDILQVDHADGDIQMNPVQRTPSQGLTTNVATTVHTAPVEDAASEHRIAMPHQ